MESVRTIKTLELLLLLWLEHENGMIWNRKE